MKKAETVIYSIFGQIEAVAAQFFIDRKLGTKIEPEMIPPSAAVNKQGMRAQFAIIIQRADVPAFERMIDNLRA